MCFLQLQRMRIGFESIGPFTNPEVVWRSLVMVGSQLKDNFTSIDPDSMWKWVLK